MKVSNVTKSITTNPLFAVVVGLLVLLVILGIIRMIQPSFSMGANIGAHFGSIGGKVNLEAFDNHITEENESFMDHGDSDMDDSSGGMGLPSMGLTNEMGNNM